MKDKTAEDKARDWTYKLKDLDRDMDERPGLWWSWVKRIKEKGDDRNRASKRVFPGR